MEDAENTPEITETEEIVAPSTEAIGLPEAPVELSAEPLSAKTDTNATDIFNWANKTDAVKNELRVEFFLFNKNYTPYTTTIDDDLDSQIKSLFLYDIINDVNLG